ncbi:glutathione S-transferase family protein [Noviherbaspirillum sp. Root189]|uniref:glutathione S-transferase family protein n=1 Tax=Noviherbaspirillum sp. Root189 TaxID=1736487 RepID=UPI00070F403F|nr:glutathione S-transferase family protein [Noviherbaspirillum sp. Root189]KRB87038.1 glutathione S-transferase [Noviherbaspirillum sp. Root189]
MERTILTISSKNYSSWSLRGWLMMKFSGLPFEEHIVSLDDPSVRAEILLLAPSILVPCLTHNGLKVWDTLAIGEYLNEVRPKAKLIPTDLGARTHCRAICGEMHSGFTSLRSALPMNIRGRFENFKIWDRAQADIGRIDSIWKDCLTTYGGPFLFGSTPGLADAMYAPVVTRFMTYHVELNREMEAYCKTVLELPAMQEWTAAALVEPEQIDELETEF